MITEGVKGLVKLENKQTTLSPRLGVVEINNQNCQFVVSPLNYSDTQFKHMEGVHTKVTGRSGPESFPSWVVSAQVVSA